ncbi:hypothetical protein B0T24DRAFT_533274 [Lasiosphaeria ovina]|uniref:Uncharacterized protein n=1 Tax=Lasiosphaeria ovina TaxID=92902 RepID=A0AAE0N3M0_9PEZI|nr:hypothetical protein B0T24DRAFT_533274 [Lasiosphaeria ovina]
MTAHAPIPILHILIPELTGICQAINLALSLSWTGLLVTVWLKVGSEFFFLRLRVTADTTFRAEPPRRGTASLLIGCLFTLSLCVWTAVHLNVPGRGTSQIWRKCRWAIAATVAPEIVVYRAFLQWQSAKLLTKEVAKRLQVHVCVSYCLIVTRHHQVWSSELTKLQSDARTSAGRHEWTITHSFYAAMGGFAFNSDESAPKRFHLTAHGVLVLAELGLLPDISEAAIRDKSKADDVGKSLAMLQASWLIIQCAGRLAAGLPVTLLEVHTIAHVMTAFVLYALWWKKPVDITDPTAVLGEWTPSLRETMLVFSRQHELLSPPPGATEEHEQSQVWALPEIDNFIILETTTDSGTPGVSTRTANDENHERRLHSAADEPELMIGHKPNSSLTRFVRANCDPEEAYFTLGAGTLERWRNIRQNLVENRAIWDRYKSPLTDDSQPLQLPQGYTAWEYPMTEFGYRSFVAQRVRNASSADLCSTGHVRVGLACSVLVALAYSGLHLASWGYDFPSDFERWAWRLSACFLVLPSIAVFCFPGLRERGHISNQPPPLDYAPEHEPSEAMLCLEISGALVTVVIIVAYILARVFLFFEALISLRRVSIKVYESPVWTQLLPHI